DSLVGDGERDLAYRSASTQPSACHHGRDETDSAPCGGGNREGSAILIDPDIGSGLKLDLATAAVEAQHGSVVCELGGGHGVIGDLLGRYGPGSDGRAVYCPASDSVGHGCPQREECARHKQPWLHFANPSNLQSQIELVQPIQHL